MLLIKISKKGNLKSINKDNIDFIKSNKPLNNFWHLFAKKLARLHNVTNDNFGLEYNNYIGSLKQENTITDNAVDLGTSTQYTTSGINGSSSIHSSTTASSTT